VKYAAMGFSSVAFPLSLLLAGVVAAQSAQRRKDIPAIAKAANDKAKGTLHEVKGSVKEKVGRVTNNRRLAAEGQIEKIGQVEKTLGA
jgi:uncharacterized protein YjbJ (UPF0337 family)